MMNTTQVAQWGVAMERYGALATPLEFRYVNDELAKLSLQVGFPMDQLRFMICLFLSYPCAWLVRRLPSPALKHWFNIFVGVSIAQFVYASGWLLSFGSAAVTYALVKFAPVRSMPYVVFGANMAFMASLHIYRMAVDYMGWSMDATASQMLLLLKLTSFAFNYHDGVVASATEMKPTDSPTRVRVKQSRKKFAITQLPSLLEFYGYVYCFTTFLAGPSFEYREYSDAIDGSKFLHKGERKRVSSAKAAATKLTIGVFFMSLLACFGEHSNVRGILYAHDTLPVKWARIMLALFLTRAKYYSAWKLAEGSTILSGTGFEGFDESGKPKGWNAVSNVDILGFEFGQSVRDLSRAWNKGTQNWLERYVYARSGNSLIATYFCSAVWHGFYPGYYFFFLTVPLATSVNRLARRHLRPLFLTADGLATALKPLYDLAGILCTSILINYLAVSFVVLGGEDSIRGFQSMHFAGHIGLLVAFLLLSAIPSKKKPASKTV